MDEDAAEDGRVDGGDLASEDAFSGGDLGCLNESAFWSLLHEPDILSFSSFNRKRERERVEREGELMLGFGFCKMEEKVTNVNLEKKRWKRRGKKQEKFKILKMINIILSLLKKI